ncbi:TIGR03617 family F420-dependent LLM class oxidoreductase [Aldersonia kunmingensis]|uniref:TIGR03617 family F420-dependent LLM class oxidoreductase n=1 Tax=Aldersonia kunmingensis TaxID=408066 RepID=UPI00082A3025|nr:TIGR03617 family F420-dependent LLM class oxidoreductase [Aldersonia kunmingensis]
MKVDLPLGARGGALTGVDELAREAEDIGADGVAFSELTGDPMLHLTVAAGATRRVDLLTNILVAFARSPMTVAVQATAIQEYSNGRLHLGLGSQIKPHIERRFSMPWSAPADRMAEFVSALRAIWHSWETGDKLDFRGDFYSHTLMTPMFVPKTDNPPPKVLIAAVGTKMTETVGKVADGLLLHPFTTMSYVNEVTLPALQRGRAVAGAPEAAPEIVSSGMIVTGRTEEEFEEAKTAVRNQIAFYGSTPAYHPVLELHGLGDLGAELNSLSKSDRPKKWLEMGELIDDHVLNLFAAVGTTSQVAGIIAERNGDATRYMLNSTGLPSAELRIELMRAIQEATR